jgi:hypothetical protein
MNVPAGANDGSAKHDGKELCMLSLILPPDVIRFPVSASDTDLFAVVKQWAEVLAAEQYEQAYGMTAHIPYYRWTPDLIRQVIEGYGLPEPHPRGPFRVTPSAQASGDRYELVAERYEEPIPSGAIGAIGEIRFNLPLNGEWSDLTARLTIHPVEQHLVLCLDEIHVF